MGEYEDDKNEPRRDATDDNDGSESGGGISPFSASWGDEFEPAPSDWALQPKDGEGDAATSAENDAEPTGQGADADVTRVAAPLDDDPADEPDGAFGDETRVASPPDAFMDDGRAEPGADDVTRVVPVDTDATIMPDDGDATVMASGPDATVMAGPASSPDDSGRPPAAGGTERGFVRPAKTDSRFPDALPVGHMLMWYEIDKVLGQGGFGITYRARDTKLDTAVAIKEFLPTQLVVRTPDLDVRAKTAQMDDAFTTGRSDFLEEARTLAKFKHANIVRVLTFFEAHGTAYMVMEYEDGKSLSSLMRKKRVVEEPEILSIAMPLLQGLNALHEAGFIHRDIKPDNIFIRNKDGSPVLLDFGAARRVGMDENMTAILTPHYAPLEQYFSDAKRQGPWTDIYAMAAVIYHAITGEKPPPAPARSDAIMRGLPDPLQPAAEKVAGHYSKSILLAVDIGLAVIEENRPKSINEWLSAVDESAEGRGVKLKGLLEGEESSISPRMRLAMAASVFVLIGGLAFSAIAILGGGAGEMTAEERLAAEVEALTESADAGDLQAMLTLGEYRRLGKGLPADQVQAAGWYRRAADRGSAEAQFRLGLAYAEGAGVPRDAARAAEWFRKAAEQTHAGAQFRYGQALERERDDLRRAFDWYRKAAAAGDADALYRVGRALEQGELGKADADAAFRNYLAAAEQGHADAQLRLAGLFLQGRGTERDTKQGIGWYRTAAESGHAEAQYRLAGILFEGKLTARNFAEAARWAARAAAQGHAKAQLKIAVAYQQGWGVPKDAVESLKWFRSAAEQGEVFAQLALAASYFRGEQVARDPAEAAKWLRRAAEAGSAEAQNSLGALYQSGTGVPRDPIAAVDWYGKAAAAGSIEAQNNLGMAFETGLGVGRDYRRAREWYRMAADAGHPVAQRNLAWMYEEGRGVGQDYEKAAYWYRKAAEQGDVRAQNTLGWMYEEGRGVPEDLVKAYAWYSLAASADHGDALRNLELLRTRLDRGQLILSQRIARAWLEARTQGGDGGRS